MSKLAIRLQLSLAFASKENEMTTFTKEQLISHVSENVKAMKFAVKQTAFKNSLEAIELDLALALVAQASLEAEPVLYMNRFTGKTFSLEEQPGADKEPEITALERKRPKGRFFAVLTGTACGKMKKACCNFAV